MIKQPTPPEQFEALLCNISRERFANEKLQVLYNSKGDFSSEQVARVLLALPQSPDKLRGMQIMSTRLCRMTCNDARDILNAVPIHNDKIVVLDFLKRALCDHMDSNARECLLTAIPYEEDKKRACGVLTTVRSDEAKKIPAGGHQGYAPVGYLYTQCPPLETHLYGGVPDQMGRLPGSGGIAVPPAARTVVPPSVYSGHPSYAYPAGTTYAEVNRFPGECAGRTGGDCTYDQGAPPLGMRSGAPQPTGYFAQ